MAKASNVIGLSQIPGFEFVKIVNSLYDLKSWHEIITRRVSEGSIPRLRFGL